MIISPLILLSSLSILIDDKGRLKNIMTKNDKLEQIVKVVEVQIDTTDIVEEQIPQIKSIKDQVKEVQIQQLRDDMVDQFGEIIVDNNSCISEMIEFHLSKTEARLTARINEQFNDITSYLTKLILAMGREIPQQSAPDVSSKAKFGGRNGASPIKDTTTGIIYKSKSEAGRVLASTFNLDPADKWVWYKILKLVSDDRFVEVVQQEVAQQEVAK